MSRHVVRLCKSRSILLKGEFLSRSQGFLSEGERNFFCYSIVAFVPFSPLIFIVHFHFRCCPKNYLGHPIFHFSFGGGKFKMAKKVIKNAQESEHRNWVGKCTILLLWWRNFPGASLQFWLFDGEFPQHIMALPFGFCSLRYVWESYFLGI